MAFFKGSHKFTGSPGFDWFSTKMKLTSSSKSENTCLCLWCNVMGNLPVWSVPMIPGSSCEHAMTSQHHPSSTAAFLVGVISPLEVLGVESEVSDLVVSTTLTGLSPLEVDLVPCWTSFGCQRVVSLPVGRCLCTLEAASPGHPTRQP